uniref:Guanylate kinase-like domain-containing protein n=1 Tax=Timema bartmani TaxID=61472 RepID=A0A7R9EU81_9NEOP|nr:unnamed protein product [Timema bartmani]
MMSSKTEELTPHSHCLAHLETSVIARLEMSGIWSVNRSLRQLFSIQKMRPGITSEDPAATERKELLAARRLFRPGEHLCVAQMHTHLTLLQHMNSPDIGLDIHPVDQGHFPIVVLVGPLASNKNLLVQRLAHLFPDKRLRFEPQRNVLGKRFPIFATPDYCPQIYAGVNHTSRPSKTDGSEVNGESYHFVSQDKFNEMTLEGKFLSITEVLGKSFGFSRDELAQAVAHHKVCVTHMDMTGALSLRQSGMRPYLVLAIPRSEQLHLAQLKDKYEARICDLTKIISLCSKGTFPPAGFEESQGESYKVIRDIMKDCLHKVIQNSPTDKFQTISRMVYSLPTEVENQKICVNTCFVINIKDSDDPLKWKLGLLTYKPKLGMSVILTSDTSGCLGYPKLSSDMLVVRAGVDTSTTVYMEKEISDLNRADLTVTLLSEKGSQFLKEADSEEDCCVANSLTSGNQKQHIDIQTTKDSNLNNTVELFLQSVIRTRESYLSLHQNNPGVFSRTIFTDDLNQALDQLTEFLKQRLDFHYWLYARGLEFHYRLYARGLEFHYQLYAMDLEFHYQLYALDLEFHYQLYALDLEFHYRLYARGLEFHYRLYALDLEFHYLLYALDLEFHYQLYALNIEFHYWLYARGLEFHYRLYALDLEFHYLLYARGLEFHYRLYARGLEFHYRLYARGLEFHYRLYARGLEFHYRLYARGLEFHYWLYARGLKFHYWLYAQGLKFHYWLYAQGLGIIPYGSSGSLSTFRSQPKQRPVFSLEEDEVIQAMSRNRLEKFQREMFNCQSTMTKQRDFVLSLVGCIMGWHGEGTKQYPTQPQGGGGLIPRLARRTTSGAGAKLLQATAESGLFLSRDGLETKFGICSGLAPQSTLTLPASLASRVGL